MPTIRSPRTSEPVVTTLHADDAHIARYTTAVSLHAHTNRSREGMSFIRPYLDRIPLVLRLARQEMKDYEQRNGRRMDFGDAWWQPPVLPMEVWDSEKAQIERGLGLRALLSITDHDSIDACLSLRDVVDGEHVPVSFEWTVPYGRGFLHLGVHNLPEAEGPALFEALTAFTAQPAGRCLEPLFERLSANPDTLVVLNHPIWDLAGIGPGPHASMLRSFLDEFRDHLHAIELNGYRSAAENRAAAALARAVDMPLVSGGDRHGRAPNSLLNLTTATSFGEFVREIRVERRSVNLVMPDYLDALVARKLRVAADVMRDYPSHPEGQRHWTERIFYRQDDGTVERLCDHWTDGGPVWVRAVIGAFERATRAPFLPALRLLVWLVGASRSTLAQPEMDIAPGVTPTAVRVTSEGLPG